MTDFYKLLFHNFNTTWKDEWNSSTPEIPLGDQYVTAPFILLLYGLIIIPYIVWLARQKSCVRPIKTLYILKFGAILTFICFKIGELIYNMIIYVYPEYIVSNICVIIALIILIFILILERWKNAMNSGFNFLYWLLILVIFVFRFQSSVSRLRATIISHLCHETFIVMSFCLALVNIFLACFSERMTVEQIEIINKKSKKFEEDLNENIELENKLLHDEVEKEPKKKCPENYCSFMNRLSFTWFTSMIWKGFKKPLKAKDLWNINEEDTTKNLMAKFDKLLNRFLYYKINQESDEEAPVTQAKGQSKDEEAAMKGSTQNGETSKEEVKESLMGDSKENNKPAKTKFDPGLLYALLYMNWKELLYSGFLKLIHDLMIFSGPILLKLLLGFMKQTAPYLIWHGYLFAVLLLAMAILRCFILHVYFHAVFRIGMRIRSALVGAIYRKSLLLSNWARRHTTAGEIVNHQSVDAQKFLELLSYIHMVWSGPLQIIISIAFIWQELGPSVLGGVFVMMLMIPINGAVGNISRNLQAKQLKISDSRIKMMNEILNGIKVLKLYAWETSYMKFITQIRDKEIALLRRNAYLNSVMTFTFMCAPLLVSLVSFGLYVFISEDNILDAEKIFVSISLFGILRFPLMMFPVTISFFIQSSVSLTRLTRFFKSSEIKKDDVSHDNTQDDVAISITNGNFSWAAKDDLVLKDINISVKKGTLVGIVGTVGSGKSTLLNAIMGEVHSRRSPNASPPVNVNGQIAYVPQQAWIVNATLRDNILFGLPYDQCKYAKVLETCCLKRDLEILKDGDLTEIGEKGINLSGGQKQRVSLARACYSNSDIFLLDDPLSAVDSHVGRELVSEVLMGTLAETGKTRVLVTHNLGVLSHCDWVVVLEAGRVMQQDEYQKLMDDKDGQLSLYITTHLGKQNEDEEVTEEIEENANENKENKHSLEKIESKDQKYCEEKLRNLGVTSKKGDKLIEEEMAAVGNVKMSVYLTYIRSVGIKMSILILFFFVLTHSIGFCTNLWLVYWSRQADSSKVTVTKLLELKELQKQTKLNSSDLDRIDIYTGELSSSRSMYLGIYSALGFGQVFSQMASTFIYVFGYVHAAKILHNNLLTSVMHYPLSFFDSIPLGRLLNRFSSDMVTIVQTLPTFISSVLWTFLSTLFTLVMVMLPNIWISIPLLCVSVLYVFIQRIYVATSRQLKRLESISKSPIYSHFSESLQGVSSIRAYSLENQFIEASDNKVDTNMHAYYANIVSNRWLAIILETIGNLIVFMASIFSVVAKHYDISVDPGLVGLSVSYALNITQTLNWLVRMSSDVESNIVSVERIQEYCDEKREADWEVPENEPPSDWPQGSIEFRNYSTRYRPGLELVLRQVSLQITSGEKVGIVGRTGSGKSSLVLALFRILERAEKDDTTEEGEIQIDGRPIHKLGLHNLRKNLTIIPQDPVLFSGTLRHNLDPFEEKKDEQLWRVLEQSNLKEFVEGSNDKLDMAIAEGGENLSVGQRQLVCLGRALLRHTQILILDEATAAVDMETDALIQQTIRKEFHQSTILTIAHRLNTVLDYDKIVVLDSGKILELGTPKELLSNPKSEFYSMAIDAKLGEQINQLIAQEDKP